MISLSLRLHPISIWFRSSPFGTFVFSQSEAVPETHSLERASPPALQPLSSYTHDENGHIVRHSICVTKSLSTTSRVYTGVDLQPVFVPLMSERVLSRPLIDGKPFMVNTTFDALPKSNCLVLAYPQSSFLAKTQRTNRSSLSSAILRTCFLIDQKLPS